MLFGCVFWCLGGPWGDFWGPWSTFGRPWASKGIPWRSQVDLFMNLGSHLEASGHQLLMKKLVWNMVFPHMLSEWFMGVFCVGLWSSRATLESEKPGKFMVGSSFFKVSLTKMRVGSGRSLRSIFC